MSELLNLVIDESLEINKDLKQIYIHPFKKNFKTKENFKILDYHWNDYKKLKKDYIYLEKLRSKLVSEVGQTLNKFHNINYSDRYWEILIGKWTHSFCTMIFDRWEVVSDLNKIDYNFELNLKKYFDKEMIIQSVDELNNIYFLNDFNSYLISKIIDYRFSKNSKFIVKYLNIDASEIKFVQKKFRNIQKSKKSIITNFFRFLFSKKLSNQKYAIFRSYLGIPDEIKLNLMLNQLPCSIPNNYFNCEPDLSLRNTLVLENKSTNDFEKFIYEKFILFMPVSFLEGFQAEKKKIEKLKLPKNPNTIFSSNINSKSLLIRYCAEKVENGSKLVLGVHGGCYGHYDIHFSEYFETKISDTYLTWGWKNTKKENVKPFGIIRRKTNLKIAKKPSLLTMIIPSMSIFEPTLESHIAHKHNNQFIFDPCFKILNNLNDKIKDKNLIMRFHNRQFGLFEYQTFEEKYPKIKKDLQKIKYEDLISRTKIFLSPYLGTGYLETLSINLPTIVFNSKKVNILRDEVKPYYEKLKKVNIFFDDEIELTNHINKIWNNPLKWWNSNNLQEVLKEFCDNFAFDNKNKLKNLKEIIVNR